MSGLARLCLEKGLEVSGSDLRMTDTTRELIGKGVQFFEGHAYENIDDTVECVVYTSAAGADNPERRAAVDKGIPLISRADYLMRQVNDKDVIAVAGSHGKTTTTSMIAEVLRVYEGENASYYIGGILQTSKTNAHRGKGRFMAVELDESDASFLLCTRGTALITTIDYEHVDFYETESAYNTAFASFINAFHGNVYIGGHAYSKVHSLLTREVQVVALDTARQPDSFTYDSFTVNGKRISLSVVGIHAVFDAWCAYCALHDVGIPHEIIAHGLATCRGAERRMQELYNDGSTVIVDDYGHHPSEIDVTFDACENKYRGMKKIVLFQPHRYSRFNMFYTEFYTIFEKMDGIVVVLPVYGAAEASTGTHTAQHLVEDLRKVRKDVVYCPTHDDALRFIGEHVQGHTAVIFFGAGDGNKVLYRLREQLRTDGMQ